MNTRPDYFTRCPWTIVCDSNGRNGDSDGISMIHSIPTVEFWRQETDYEVDTSCLIVSLNNLERGMSMYRTVEEIITSSKHKELDELATLEAHNGDLCDSLRVL